MLNLIATGIVLGVPSVFIGLIVYNYITAPPDVNNDGKPDRWWHLLIHAFRASATIAWTRLNAIGIAIVGAVGEISTWAGAPGIKDTIAPYLEPKYMTAYMLILLVGAEITRRRTLK